MPLHSWTSGESGNTFLCSTLERTVPVKKILAFVLMLAVVGSLSMSTIGCGKKAEEKKGTTPPAEKKTEDKKAP